MFKYKKNAKYLLLLLWPAIPALLFYGIRIIKLFFKYCFILDGILSVYFGFLAYLCIFILFILFIFFIKIPINVISGCYNGEQN